MSSVINPLGPEEPSTYWRRRAVVLVALLVVLVAGFLIVRALLGGSEEDSVTPSGTASQSPQPAPSGSSASSTPGDSPSGNAGGCAAGDISVTAATASKSAAVGKGMKLTMTIKNTGEAACSRDVGAGANELQVRSGAVLVWSSDFCGASGSQDVEVIEPGQEYSSTVTWPGTIVTKECPSGAPVAKAGSYKVQGRNGAILSEPVAFSVE